MGYALFIIILLTGLLIVLIIHLGGVMNDFNAAIARLQASATKIEAKVDILATGNDAALSAAAVQINAVSDQLDAKSA